MNTPSAESQFIQRGSLHYIEGRRLYASHGNLILTGFAGEPLRVLARLPLGAWGSICSSQRLLSRLLRQHVYHVAPFRDRVVVMGFGRIWCVDSATGRLQGRPVPLVGGRPLALCVTPLGLYYGEYRNNEERRPIRLLFSEDGLKWTVVRELQGVRHIHGVYHDPYTDCLWLTTGDEDHESAIWRSCDRFASVEQVLRGSQQARAICLLFTQKHVFFGSDTPLEQNYLYRLDRDSDVVTRLIPVEGSVFHAARCRDYLLFSTAVEPSKANHSRDAVLYASVDGESWQVLARHPKDAWHMSYFQYGQLPLPSGKNDTGQFWYSTFAVDEDYSICSGRLHVQ